MEKVINQKAQKAQFKYRETEIECSLIWMFIEVEKKNMKKLNVILPVSLDLV